MTGTLTGRVFNGRYQIGDRVGIGGMAEVYSAQDLVLGRTVAVKVMLPQFATDESFAQRFKQEAASAANLQSPYIVNIYDWGQDQGTYFIVMEFVRGSDLKTGIRERGALNQRKVAEIGVQVCQALSVAHNMDIIHRDIKPQNIMVQPDGNIKVMDFGIARAKNSVDEKSSVVLGTAHYIAPEQAQGKEITAASDIYSLGVVLYEAATGKLPFDGQDAVTVALKQVNEQPAPPIQVNPDLDPTLNAIILKAMQKDPRARFSTAKEMQRALEDFLVGRRSSAFNAAETAFIGTAAGAAAVSTITAADKTSVMPLSAKANQRVTGVKPSDVRRFRTEREKQQAAQTDGKGSSNGGNKKLIGIIAGAALLILAIVLGMMFFGGGSGDPVPDVTGKTTEEAATILREAGFVLGNTDQAYSDKVEAGKIISQDPPANHKAQPGSKVNVVVSRGIEKLVVPDLKGKTASEAQQILTKMGLVAASGEAQYSSEVEVNKIISQSPEAGAEINKGDTVTYVLSLGVENVSVPNVIGLSESNATAKLQEAGFVVSVQEQSSDEYDPGMVISQNPGSNAKMEKGGTVTITVSTGPDQPQPVDIPNVTGMSIDEATAMLESAGFLVNVHNQSGSEEAHVVSYSPTGSAVPGVTITIYVQ